MKFQAFYDLIGAIVREMSDKVLDMRIMDKISNSEIIKLHKLFSLRIQISDIGELILNELDKIPSIVIKVSRILGRCAFLVKDIKGNHDSGPSMEDLIKQKELEMSIFEKKKKI